MKKSISLLLILVLVFTMSTSVFAGRNNIKKIDLDQYLLEMGTPLDLVLSMNEETKSDIVNDDLSQKEKGAFSGASITRSYVEESENIDELSYKKEFNSLGEVIYETLQKKGTIDDSDLELTVVYYKYSDYVSVYLNYEWLNPYQPFNRYQDPIGITWDYDYFRYMPNTFKRYDYAIDFCGDKIKRSGATLSDTHNEGLGWHADLIGPFGAYEKNYGYGKFRLEKKATSAKTEFYYKYTHVKTAAAYTINIAGYGSITIDGGSHYDTQANTTWVEY
ncbi:MAG: hypothetical protein U9N10_00745 [Bacillota bacterium]|nr:hypothetical protein [Bacillota bacterium]